MCEVSQRGFDNKTEYGTTPVEQAGKYKDHGLKAYI